MDAGAFGANDASPDHEFDYTGGVGAATVSAFVNPYLSIAPGTADASQYCGGAFLEEIAKRRAVSLTTARNQLKAIFSKTDAHRQRELAALLARFSPPVSRW